MNAFSRRRDVVGIEIAPLIDIVFILLIFFVVTSTFIHETTLEIDLPVAQSASNQPVDGGIEIVISAADEIAIEGQPVPDATVEGLRIVLALFAEQARIERAIVRADANSRHETVVRALDALKLLDITDVSIVTVQANG